VDGGDSAASTSIFLALGFSCSQALSQPAPPPLTQTVETVEKVPFQKLTFEKWVKNIEKHLVFCVLNDILAIFELVVGDFCEIFSNKRFFDSFVGTPLASIAFGFYWGKIKEIIS
jgi:hypothetical protein